MNIPFSPPYIDDDVLSEVQDSLNSGWITTGPKVKELENLTAKIAEVPYALGVNSATSGLMLALHWYGISRGDEVIIPAYTYTATALAVMHIGAQPVMVDCGDHFNLDVSRIAEKITSKTKAILPVDIGGWPCDYKAILNLVESPEINTTCEMSSRNLQCLRALMRTCKISHAARLLLRRGCNNSARGNPLTISAKGSMSVFSSM